VIVFGIQSFWAFGEPELSALIDCTGRAAAATSIAPADSQAALARACEYLWSNQAADGGWHSEQYAVLRSGQALTPFVLHALLLTIDGMSSDDTGRVMRALDFIHKRVDPDGAIGRADPDILEYPVYSTAYAVMCLKRVQSYRHLRSDENAALIARMEAYLIKCQFDEGDGFAPKDAAFGGWGFDAARQPGQPGHMDLAHTRRSLAALHRQPIGGQRDAIRERALEFLKVVQKHPDAHQRQPLIEGFSPMTAPITYDGGFYFSPVVLAANKGREEFKDAKYFRSYATATCDGILALIAAGVSRDDQRVVRAVAWLRAHDDLTYPQGVPTDHPEPWGEAIRYYHFAVRAEAYDVLDWPGDWRARLGAVIGVHQLADGSFRNAASPLMKEDDPLLCTALAATALAHCAANR
jgi:squalene-hopene/tetraprenyl-beta-curcumene cyclase